MVQQVLVRGHNDGSPPPDRWYPGNTDGYLVTPTEFHSAAPGVTVSQSLMTRLHVEDNGNTVMD